MKQPTTVPRITTLQKLVVNHKHIFFRDHVNHLSKWVRRMTAQSHLEHLELAMDDLEYFRGPYANYGGLVEHISYRHGRTIRVLRLTHGYIDSATITLLCQKCPNLEDISLGVNADTLVRVTSNEPFLPDLTRSPPQREFPQKAASLSKLRRVAFRVCNIKAFRVAKIFTDELATDFFETLKGANLRYLTVNSIDWEVSVDSPEYITRVTRGRPRFSIGEVGHR